MTTNTNNKYPQVGFYSWTNKEQKEVESYMLKLSFTSNISASLAWNILQHFENKPEQFIDLCKQVVSNSNILKEAKEVIEGNYKYTLSADELATYKAFGDIKQKLEFMDSVAKDAKLAVLEKAELVKAEGVTVL